LTLLFVASVQMQFLATDGVQFVVASMLPRAISVYRASHRLLALAWTVPAPATPHRALWKPRRHLLSKPRCCTWMKWLLSPSVYLPTSLWSRCRQHRSASLLVRLLQGYMLMPHTLEYNYSLPSPTPVPETQVAACRSIPSGALDPWYFNTVVAPMI
jgi:hypothetical protein